jgi:hypothetical protein
MIDQCLCQSQPDRLVLLDERHRFSITVLNEELAARCSSFAADLSSDPGLHNHRGRLCRPRDSALVRLMAEMRLNDQRQAAGGGDGAADAVKCRTWRRWCRS